MIKTNRCAALINQKSMWFRTFLAASKFRFIIIFVMKSK